MLLEHDLERLHEQLMSLSAEVQHLIGRAVNALDDPKPGICDEFRKLDADIDERDVRIEEECVRLLALHQPVADDLRWITTALKISAELEHIADLGVNIAERAEALIGSNRPKLAPQIREMADIALEMLRQSIDAYVTRDPTLARAVCRRDDVVDGLNRRVIDELREGMKRDSSLVDASMHVFSASRHIECVADHATNIAEDVVYLVEGEIIRHRSNDVESNGSLAAENFESKSNEPHRPD